MKLINKSNRNYMAFDTILKAGEELEIENQIIIKMFLAQDGVEEVVDVKKLEKENELNKLKLEAMELGIEFSKQIGIKKLKEKIEKFKAEQGEN